MTTHWKDISDDDILTFTGERDNSVTARYERILQKRATDAVHGLTNKLTGLMDTIHTASQLLQEKADQLRDRYDKAARSQARQQWALIVLSVVVALSTVAYTIITWQSVAAMQDANQIQRQLLEIQKRQAEQGSQANASGKARSQAVAPAR